MHQDRLHLDAQDLPVDGLQRAIVEQAQYALGGRLVVLDDRAGQGPGRELAIGLIGPVGEEKVDGAASCGAGRRFQLRAAEHEIGDVGVEGAGGAHQRIGHRPVGAGEVAQRAMRVHVADLAAMRPGQALQCAELVEHMLFQLVEVHRHGAAPEAHAVRIAHMRADIDARRLGQAHRAVHDDRIAGVITAGEVGGGDDLHDPCVVGDRVGPETFPEVGIEIDPHGHAFPSIVNRCSP